MLNIIYGDVKNSIYNTNVYFKHSYEPEWLDAELAKKMIKDIDDSEVLSGECINSPVLGQIPPEGRIKDVTINLRHMMSFGKDTKFEIKVQNGGETVHSMKELVPIANKYLNEMKQE